ncbi:MAG: hypothetical protein HYZ14_04015 [Bacteroidetes bacterium]|nr:hypothetical protein [Bacteroidota bacterium]
MRVERVEEIKFHTDNGWFKNYENFESMPEQVKVRGYIYIWIIIISLILFGYAVYFTQLISRETSFQLAPFLISLVTFGIIIKMARDKIIARTEITLFRDRIIVNGQAFNWSEVENMHIIYYSNSINSDMPPSISIKLKSGRPITFVFADLSTTPGYSGDLPRILYMFWKRGVKETEEKTSMRNG